MHIRHTEFGQYASKHLGVNPDTIQRYYSSIEGMTRSVVEERPRPFREIDVFSRLIMDRIIFLGSVIQEEVANVVLAQLLFLRSQNEKAPITFYINSPGGDVYGGFSIYDTMQYVGGVHTICTGLAASMAAVLLAGGEKENRGILPHARVMIHQPLLGSSGGGYVQAEDVRIKASQILALRNDIYEVLANDTGRPIAQIEKDADRDFYMTATEAIQYGVVDNIYTRKLN